MPLYHIGWPDVKMYAIEVKKELKRELENVAPVDGAAKENAILTIGVRVHWLDRNHTYQTAMFHTNEMRKWPETNS